MTWKLVPVEPTGKMWGAGDLLITACVAEDVWTAMLSASPDPTTDEALVERVARVIAKMFNEEEHWYLFRAEALAAIRAMEEKP